MVFFGSNLQFLRRRSGFTQESLAQRLQVSRQAISKWESADVLPDPGKLLELADIFSCTLDALLREDLSVQALPVRLCRVQGFRYCQYIMISANARADAEGYMTRWAADAGLPAPPRLIGWSFPYVSAQQKNQFGLQGYVCGCILPQEHTAVPSGPEPLLQEEHDYACISLPEPDGREPQRIAQGIQTILAFLQNNGIKKSAEEGFLPAFEYRYEKDGIPMVDLYLQCRDACPQETVSI